MWHEIRQSGTNKLLCRYDPERNLIEVAHRGEKTIIDLSEYAPHSAMAGNRDADADGCNGVRKADSMVRGVV